MAYSVSQRTHEFGLRMALGAKPGDVLRLVLRQGVQLTLLGLVFGLAGALVLGRFLRTLLFEVSAADPMTFVFVPAVAVAIAIVACYIPARRAAKVEPMVALRYE